MGGAASKAAAEQQRALRATPHKLTYFFIAGPCFATRVCLRKAGVPFTDERLIIDVTWPTYPKEHLLMGTLPALTIGDHGTFSQSVPLSRYAAQLAARAPPAIPPRSVRTGRTRWLPPRRARRMWRGCGGGGCAGAVPHEPAGGAGV